MSEELLQDARTLVARLLDKPTDGLSADQLLSVIRDGIAAERAKRAETHGGYCTLTLNTLLALEGKRVGRTGWG